MLQFPSHRRFFKGGSKQVISLSVISPIVDFGSGSPWSWVGRDFIDLIHWYFLGEDALVGIRDSFCRGQAV